MRSLATVLLASLQHATLKEVLPVSPGKTYNVTEVARSAGVHRSTLIRWLYAKKIPEPRRDRNGWRAFTERERSAIVAFAKAYTSPHDHAKQTRLISR